MFSVKLAKTDNMKSVRFDDTRVIRTIHGDANKFNICKLHFKDINGGMIAKVEACNLNFGKDMQLEEGEEIIGVYGHKNSNFVFHNLGFIVWTPHYE